MKNLKFSTIFKLPCNFHSNSEQAKHHKEATFETNPELFGKMRVFVSQDGRIFKHLEKHYIGVLHVSVAGGKWVEVTDNSYQTKEQWLDYIKSNDGCTGKYFKEDSFRGQPRLINSGK